jgi:glycosyltransferase involved in cell wall biosynthesis
MEKKIFEGRLGLQQRVLPNYRVLFFDYLATFCMGGLSVFAGQPLPEEGITSADKLDRAQLYPAQNLHVFDPGSPIYLCWQRGILKWLESMQPDALVIEANPRYLASRLAIRWMRRRGRPVIGWGLGAPLLRGPFSQIRRWERLSLLHQLDAVIAYSQRGAEEYLALGLQSDRVFTAFNAVAFSPVAPPLIQPDRSNSQPVVLFVGRLQKRKRVDTLLRVCSGLPPQLKPRLLVVGDGPERDALESLAQEIFPLTQFFGARHGVELAPLFAQADLFVLPGSGGLAIQEAMAHGLPVIVGRGDGTQDDLVRPECGWQIPADDELALRTALVQALSEPNRLREMGLQAYRIVKEDVNIEKMAEVFIRVLRLVSKAGI